MYELLKKTVWQKREVPYGTRNDRDAGFYERRNGGGN